MNMDCFVLFSQCDFKGDYIEICEDNRDLRPDFPTTRSIYIPDGFRKLPVILYSEVDYVEEIEQFLLSDRCIKSL